MKPKTTILARQCLKSLFFSFVFLIASGLSGIAQGTTFSPVTTTTVDSTGADGTDPHWDVSFEVDTTGTNNNANGGWIIQKITMSLKIDPCPGTEGPSIDTTVVYFEVWPVAAGDNEPAPEFLNGASDRWAPNPASMAGETYGSFSVSSELTYVSNPGGGSPATPGDAGGPDTNRTEDGGSTWGNTPDTGGVPEAGGLISTYTPPSFWDSRDPSKVSTRSWVVTWNNCEEEEEVVDEEVIEDPDGGGRQKAEQNTYLDQEQLSFYPNPATNQITTIGSAKIEVKVFNISGQILLESKDRTVNIENLPAGSYIIQLTSENSNITKHMIIQ